LLAFLLIWGLASLMKSATCGVCGEAIKRERFQRTIRGHEVSVCAKCNRGIEEKISRAAVKELMGEAAPERAAITEAFGTRYGGLPEHAGKKGCRPSSHKALAVVFILGLVLLGVIYLLSVTAPTAP